MLVKTEAIYYNVVMFDFRRSAGVLLHISSLPSKYGIGTFGRSAFEFVDWLQACGFSYWQVLPLGPTSFGDSPYQSFSSFAGNPYFIDLEQLIDEKLLLRKEAVAVNFGSEENFCDYGRLYEEREKILRLAFNRFEAAHDIALCEKFLRETFGTLYPQLEAYFLFCALKKEHQRNWFEEDAPIKFCEQAALAELRTKFSHEINFQKFIQYMFFSQYFSLKRYANERGIRIIGDVPFYSLYDSCDCWNNPREFSLDENLAVQFVGGCPPDIFSDDGQYWGMPTYNWEAMKQSGYSYWFQRLDFNFMLFDVVRLDHFRGFESFWKIDARETVARNGVWEKSGGEDFFTALKNHRTQIPIIAEDLGVITDEVRHLQRFCNFPGMKILQFECRDGGQSPYLPNNYADTFSVVYPGTHDNETTAGWCAAKNSQEVLFAEKYLDADGIKPLAKKMVRLALSAVSFLAVIPSQDILLLYNSARMNLPASMGNWRWRLTHKNFAELKNQVPHLRELLTMYNRR